MIKGPAMIRPTPPLPNRQPMVMEPSSASPVRLFRVEATLTQAAGLRASLQPAPSRPRPRPQKGRSPIRPCFFIYDTTHTQRQRQSGRGRAEAVVNASSLVRGGNLSQPSSRPTTKCREHRPSWFVETEPGELSRLQVQHHPSPCCCRRERQYLPCTAR